ncbi:HdeD family acid-resistance protein [Agromyces sp. NPDC058064]|uniref:HdeD family acid-resistance protein n=1 Tax=unclassified Agromyces TaxID=2639701 RepID=UPI0036DF512A
MSNPQSTGLFATFSLDSEELSKSAINTVRATLGISGAVALIVGILITFWPKDSAVVLTAILAVYFLIAGIAYLGLGIFSRGISGGARALDIILGVLFILGAVLAFANLGATTAFLAVFIAILIGVLWIVEGVVALVQIGDAPSKGWAIFFGLLSILAGIVLLFSPIWGAVVLFVIAGIALIVLGIVQIVRAFTFGRGAKV